MPNITALPVADSIKVSTGGLRPESQAPQIEAAQPSPQVSQANSQATAGVGNGKAEQDLKLTQRLEKEKEFRSIQRRLAQEKQELEALRARVAPALEVMTLAEKGELVKALEKAGIKYDAYTNAYLAQNAPSPEQIAEAKAKEIADQKFKEFEQKAKEREDKHAEEMLSQTRRQLTRDVDAIVKGSESFPYAKALNGSDIIAQFIENEFESTENLLSVEEAGERYENFMHEAFSGILKNDVLRDKLLSQYVTQAPTKQMTARERSSQPQTITQRLVAPTPMPHKMTAAEKRQRAIDILEGRIQP